MVRRRIRVVLVLGWVLAAAGGARAEAVDYGTYAELLQAHVRDGVVDYAGFKADEARLDDYLARNGRVNPESLSEAHKGQNKVLKFGFRVDRNPLGIERSG